MSERSERVGRRRERRRRRPGGRRSTRATTATTPEDPPRAADPGRRPVNAPGRGGAAHGRGRQRHRPLAPGPRRLRTPASSGAGLSAPAGPPEGWLWLAPRRRPTPDRRSAARRSGGQRAHCARSRATPPPSITAPQHITAVLLRSRRAGSRSLRGNDHGRQTKDRGASLPVTKPSAPSSLRAGPVSHLTTGA